MTVVCIHHEQKEVLLHTFTLNQAEPSTAVRPLKIFASVVVSLGLEPPKGRYWTLHCVRAGAATAANALKIPIPKIRACGGWGRRSQVPEDRYIDHMCRACDDARRFFGWLAD